MAKNNRLSERDMVLIIMQHTDLSYALAQDSFYNMLSAMTDFIAEDSPYKSLQEIADDYLFHEVNVVYLKKEKCGLYFTKRECVVC